MASVRLLGPDLREPLIIQDLDVNQTIEHLKERALGQWPSGMDVPLIGQVRIIHQGRFLEDRTPLKDAKCAVGEQTAMHLIIKAQASKPAEASGDTDKAGANSRCACVIS